MDIRQKIQTLAQSQQPDESWVELATLLKEVKKEKLFKKWNFKNFSTYCSADLWFGKSVASDILKGRAFIHEYFPERISVSDGKSSGFIPGYNDIAILRRAKSKIPQKDFDRLNLALFSEEVNHPAASCGAFRRNDCIGGYAPIPPLAIHPPSKLGGILVYSIKRDGLKSEIAALIPPKEKCAESIEDLKAEIRELKARIRELESMIRYKKGNLNGFDIESLKKLHRRIAYYVHPDRNGDTRVMQEVNALFDNLMN